MVIADLRKDYTLHGLHEDQVADDPLVQFRAWFDQALAAGLPEPNAMTLATVGADGAPSARIVLLKGIDDGFVFFSNYTSRKGQEIAHDPRVALIFYWNELERQVRVEGRAAPTDTATSDAYYASRPRGSQLGAWASPQSTVVHGRAALDARLAETAAHYGEGTIPRPPHWGGYRVVPHTIEFWQGRSNRMHDRIRYQRAEHGWRRERLAP
jgi:pyridoxamine 5'-phosphate oxidase